MTAPVCPESSPCGIVCKMFSKLVNPVLISRSIFILFISSLLIFWTYHRYELLQAHSRPLLTFYNDSYRELFPARNPKVVLVFIHMQKTGGTYIERQLTKKGVYGLPCRCTEESMVCDCNMNGRIWLVSRYSTGWICGLHADFTELRDCVPKMLTNSQRKFAFFTTLRNPEQRYLSEWLHVRRGATWKDSTLRCRGQPPSSSQYQPCSYIEGNTSQLSFHSFVSCPRSLSNNRQTRMLASLDSLGCYADLEEWSRPLDSNATTFSPAQQALLESAQSNLATALTTFGLTEHIVYSQYMYRAVFGLVFREPFHSANATHAEMALQTPELLPPDWERETRQRNYLDKQLFRFGRELFARRVTVLLLSDSRLPLRLRARLRWLPPHLSVLDPFVEEQVSRRLKRLFELEAAARRKRGE